MRFMPEFLSWVYHQFVTELIVRTWKNGPFFECFASFPYVRPETVLVK
eukprot:COSAG06_NODE_71308_length_185_cov_89.000000_1_plen_48_part_01